MDGCAPDRMKRESANAARPQPRIMASRLPDVGVQQVWMPGVLTAGGEPE